MNLLIIGRENSWLVNARGTHKQYFIGTRQAIGLSSKAESRGDWERLAKLVLKYAAIGSKVKVFCLHPRKGGPRLISQFTKSEGTLF